MNPDYSKRDCLLPAGCKDLMDTLRMQAHKIAQVPLQPKPLTFAPDATMTRELLVPAHATVLQVAMLLKKKPIRIIFDLMDMGISAPITAEVDFDTVAAIVRRYGYLAKKRA